MEIVRDSSDEGWSLRNVPCTVYTSAMRGGNS